MQELGFRNNPSSEDRSGYSITASDWVLWLSMRNLDPNSMKPGIATIAALGMLALPKMLAEIIDYHQHLYSS